MEQVGEEIGRIFADKKPTRILTAEVSGLIPAAMASPMQWNGSRGLRFTGILPCEKVNGAAWQPLPRIICRSFRSLSVLCW